MYMTAELHTMITYNNMRVAGVNVGMPDTTIFWIRIIFRACSVQTQITNVGLTVYSDKIKNCLYALKPSILYRDA